MSQFEKYHPILTPHYAFDWLTKARAIDVLHLDQQRTPADHSLTSTATRINQTMRDIFSDQQLIWGVSDRQTGAFLGQVGYAPIDMTAKTATLTVDLMANFQTEPVYTEIIERLVAFGTAELKLTELTVTLPTTTPTLVTVLKRLNFTPIDQQRYRYQA